MIEDFEIKGKGKEAEMDFFCSDYTYLFFFPILFPFNIFFSFEKLVSRNRWQ